jgi:undecaprenyl-diphosphatase
MTVLITIILGILQGLTEFLPISSSAHLVFAEHLIKLPFELRLSYNAFLHLGTTLALLIFFGKRIIQIIGSIFTKDLIQQQTNLPLILYIIIGSIPVALIGGIFKDSIEQTFTQPIFPTIFLLVTGILLILTIFAPNSEKKFNWKFALIIGIVQAVALLPGISRSGTTIAIALLLGISSSESFEFSFLLSIPAVIGANILTLNDLANSNISGLVIVIGIVVTTATGLLALFLLKNIVLRRKLYYFGFYCIVASILALIIF